MLRGRDCLSVKGATAGTICAISAKNLIQVRYFLLYISSIFRMQHYVLNLLEKVSS